MLLTIHNLPVNIQYGEVKMLLKEKCGLNDILLDNLMVESKTSRKVTVGVPDEGDAAIIVRKINGLYVGNQQLYVEDSRRKPGLDQPFRSASVQSSQPYPETRLSLPRHNSDSQRLNTPGNQRFYSFNSAARFNTPGEARFTTPAEARFNTPGEARFTTPAEARFNTPGEARFDTPGAQSFNSSGNHSFDSSGTHQYSVPESQRLRSTSNYGANTAPYGVPVPYNAMQNPMMQSYPYMGGVYCVPSAMQDQIYTGYQSEPNAMGSIPNPANPKADSTYQPPLYAAAETVPTIWEDRRPAQAAPVDRFRRSPDRARQRSRSPRGYGQRQDRGWGQASPGYKNPRESSRPQRSSPPYSLGDRESRDSRKRPSDDRGRRFVSPKRPAYERPMGDGAYDSKRGTEDRRRFEGNSRWAKDRDAPAGRFSDPKARYLAPPAREFERAPEPHILTPEQQKIKRENMDETFRGQATSKLANMIMYKIDGQHSKGLVKTLKKSIRHRIDLMFGKELQTSVDDIVNKYQSKYSKLDAMKLYKNAVQKLELATQVSQGLPAFENVNLKQEMPDVKPVIGAPDRKPVIGDRKRVTRSWKPVLPPSPAVKSRKIQITASNGARTVKTNLPAKLKKGPESMKNNRNFVKEMKRSKKLESDCNVMYTLEPLQEAALDKELEAIANVFNETNMNPENDEERAVYERMTNETLDKFLDTVSKTVKKRLLNINNELAVRVFYSVRPQKSVLELFLKQYGVCSLFKSNKTNFFVAAFRTYDDYDEIIAMKTLQFGEILLTFKPLYIGELKPKITKVQYRDFKKMVIESQVEDFVDEESLKEKLGPNEPTNIKPKEDIVEPNAELVEPKEDFDEPSENSVEPSGDFVEASEESVEPSEDFDEPSEDFVEPREESVEPREESVEPSEDFDEPNDKLTDNENEESADNGAGNFLSEADIAKLLEVNEDDLEDY